MLKQYFVEFWNKQNQKVGIQLSAYSALDAKMYAEKMPEFRTLCNYPKLVG